MNNFGKGQEVHDCTPGAADHEMKKGRGRKYYVEAKNIMMIARRESPSASMAYPTEDQGITIGSLDTQYPECSDFCQLANISHDEAISLGEWNLAWQTDKPPVEFQERYTHHLPPPGPVS